MNLKEIIKNAYFNGESVSDIAAQYDISEEEVLEILGITKFESLFKDEKTWMQRYIRIQCIQERTNFALTIHKGEVVYADLSSLYIDSDGDTFMEVYDSFGKYMGNCNMKRFQSVK